MRGPGISPSSTLDPNPGAAMLRVHYILGAAYLALCIMLLRGSASRPEFLPHPTGTTHIAPATGEAGAWFASMKPYCNAVEVETRQRATPPPETLEGLGYSAGCYALGGKIDLARETIRRVPADQQYKATGIVFALAHPVADAGDDKSAGPIMELVLEFWPNHYQARYHAGMSSYILGNAGQARLHLTRFVDEYRQNDGWRRNAEAVLQRLDN